MKHPTPHPRMEAPAGGRLDSTRRPAARWAALGLAALGGALLCSGCASAEKEVQRAARDWCMTIRGSQVIPVYPLTEDIQPGDIFLVQVPVDRQQQLYKEKGFLPLDNHIARLDPSGYREFYSHSFLTNDASSGQVLPRDWIRPYGAGLYFGTNSSNSHAWQAAPRAAFPSYSFEIEQGAGLNLAVPVQGVPVAMGLLASDAASGTLQIQDARTLGVDTISLYGEVREWASTNAGFLHHFGAGFSERKTNFLRVITRVYATGRMMVSLTDASSRSAGVDAGAPKPVDLLTAELPPDTHATGAALRNYTNAWNALSEMVTSASTARDAAGSMLPGGSLRLAAASNRSVSLDETFDPPVILGYLGFDCAIFKGGLLGPPIPTHAVLDPAINLGHLLNADPVHSQMLDKALYGVITQHPSEKAGVIRAQLDTLKAFVPNTFVEYSTERPGRSADHLLVARTLQAGELHAEGFPDYLAYHGFRARLDASIKALEAALALERFRHQAPPGEPETVSEDSPLRRDLESALSYYRNLNDQITHSPVVQSAFAGAHAFYLEILLQ